MVKKQLVHNLTHCSEEPECHKRWVVWGDTSKCLGRSHGQAKGNSGPLATNNVTKFAGQKGTGEHSNHEDASHERHL